MTKKIMVLLVSVLMISALAIAAANGQGKGPGNGNGSGECRFIDENGDGINDNFRDHDGDGIPNHDDPDWTRPRDGSGYKNGWHHRNNEYGQRGNGRFGDGSGPHGFQNRGNGKGNRNRRG